METFKPCLMLSKPLTFDQLPAAVEILFEQQEKLMKQQEDLKRLILAQYEKGQAPSANKFLTAQEAAEFLSLAVPTIYTMASRGDLPFMKRSKRIYFKEDELSSYLKAGRRKGSIELMK